MGALIHNTAVIDPTAEIADGVEIGPCVVIEGNVRIGAGTRILPNAFVGKNTTMGEENVLHMGAVVGHLPQDLDSSGDEDARLLCGDRNVFRECCTVHRGSRDGGVTRIGSDNFIMAQSHIAHDCVLGDRIILAGGALLAGHVTVEDRAFISGNVAVHQFCRIGTLAMVAGLARVSRDPPPYFLVQGDSVVAGVNKVGMQRAGLNERERQLIRRAYKILYRRGLRQGIALQRIEASFPGNPHTTHLVEFIRASKRGICPHHRRR